MRTRKRQNESDCEISLKIALKNITNITGLIRADKKSKSFGHYLILNISPFPCSFPVEYHI